MTGMNWREEIEKAIPRLVTQGFGGPEKREGKHREK